MSASRSEAGLRRHARGPYRYVRLRWRVIFAICDFLGAMALVIGRGLGMLLRGVLRRPDVARGEPRRILVVQLDHLGDAILSTVLFPALRRRWPAARIEVLAGAWNEPLFAAIPEVDCVHISRVNRFARAGSTGWLLATLAWGLALRRRRFDVAIDVRGELPLALLLWLTGAPVRLGWDAGGGGFLLTHSPGYMLGRPEVDSRRALLAELGIRPAAGEESWRPAFTPPAAARQRVAELLSSAVGPRVVVHVAAGTAAKRWPVEHWRALVSELVAEDAQVVLVGSEADRIIARHIATLATRERAADGALVDLTGALSLLELAALIETAELMVGADSGPAHLAAAVGTPVVVLFSGTNDAWQWRPVGRQVRVVRHAVGCSPCHREDCPRAGHPCMRGIAPATVAAAAAELLAADTKMRRKGVWM